MKKMFREWSEGKHFVLWALLIVGCFVMRHWQWAYASIEAESISWEIGELIIIFPRYVWVFLVVNVLLPGFLVLSFRVLEKEKTFGDVWECSALVWQHSVFYFIAALAYGKFVYAYKGVDEAVAIFAAYVIVATFIYGYRQAVKMDKVKKLPKVVAIIGVSVIVLALLVVNILCVKEAFDGFGMWGTLWRWKYERNTLALILYLGFSIVCCIAVWFFWKKSPTFSRKVFAFPSLLMLVTRWGYAVVMNLGLVPEAGYFVGLPYQGEYVGYDFLCVGIIVVCTNWEAVKGKMQFVKTLVEETVIETEEQEEEEEEMYGEITNIEIMEELCEKLKVDLGEISCFLLENGNIHVRGGLKLRDDYKQRGVLNVKADVLNGEGKIIYNLEENEERNEENIYDSFYLRSYGEAEILKEFDLSECKLRVYPIIRKK